MHSLDAVLPQNDVVINNSTWKLITSSKIYEIKRKDIKYRKIITLKLVNSVLNDKLLYTMYLQLMHN